LIWKEINWTGFMESSVTFLWWLWIIRPHILTSILNDAFCFKTNLDVIPGSLDRLIQCKLKCKISLRQYYVTIPQPWYNIKTECVTSSFFLNIFTVHPISHSTSNYIKVWLFCLDLLHSYIKLSIFFTIYMMGSLRLFCLYLIAM
jgi:hypothetical protein